MLLTIQYIKKELTGLYPETEIESFIRLLFESVCGWNYTAQFLNKDRIIEKVYSQEIEKAVLRLKKFEPIQYIFGETEFFGLKLKVNPSVLIPRPETEELVNWIIENKLSGSSRILDIGTGSGCIALSLKNQIKEAKIFGVDISEEALKVAKNNAILNDLEVRFFQVDILNWENFKWGLFDVIVSNPPYVCEIEKQEMQLNVLKYEPENALFVPDEEPLIFYERIAEFAQKYLGVNGKLFFEINENLGEKLLKLLEDKGFVDIELKKDINNKTRMLCSRKKNTI